MLSAIGGGAVSLASRLRGVGGRGGRAAVIAACLAVCLLVLPAAAETVPTPVGSGITVTVGGCTVTFSTVTAAGLTSAETPASPPALAAPYSAIGPVYDIETTAGHSGPVTVTLRCYDPSALSGGGARLALLAHDPSAAAWKDVTISRDAASGLVSGQANALGLVRLAVTPSVVPIQGTMWICSCPGDWPGYLYALSGNSSQREPVPPRFAYGGPALTQDGQRVAYTFGNDSALHVSDTDGSNDAALPVDTVYCNIVWSRDGTRLAFTRPAANSPSSSPAPGCYGGEVFVMNADGSGLQQITHQSTSTSVPLDWSPDGRSLLWKSLPSCQPSMEPPYEPCALWAGSPTGSSSRAQIAGPGQAVAATQDAHWSPDGRRIALGWATGTSVYPDLSGTWTSFLGTVAPDGSDPRPLLQVTSPAGYPDPWRAWVCALEWSPDGGQIAFANGMHALPAPGDATDTEVYVINADGTGLSRLTYNATDDSKVLRWVGANTQPGTSVFDYAVFANGALTATNTVNTTGRVFANGNVVLNNTGTIKGDLRSTGTIKAPKMTVTGSVAQHAPPVAVPAVDYSYYQSIADHVLTGPITLSGTTVLDGVTYVNGNCTIAGTVTGAGVIVATGTITVSGQATLGAPGHDALALVGKSVVLTNKCALQGWIISAGPCKLHNATTITGGLVAGSLTANGPLSVTYQWPLMEVPGWPW